MPTLQRDKTSIISSVEKKNSFFGHFGRLGIRCLFFSISELLDYYYGTSSKGRNTGVLLGRFDIDFILTGGYICGTENKLYSPFPSLCLGKACLMHDL